MQTVRVAAEEQAFEDIVAAVANAILEANGVQLAALTETEGADRPQLVEVALTQLVNLR
jgi:hypothetical protein